MSGKTIGLWTVLEKIDAPAHVVYGKKQAWWLCRCVCGKEKAVNGVQLRIGCTRSCGCARNYSKTADNLSRSPLYQIWNRMHLKCYKKTYVHYKNYGGKGISVCDEWKSVRAFVDWGLDGWRSGHSLDIKKGFHVFSPETCYWVVRGQRSSNTKLKNRKEKYKDIIGKKFGYLTAIAEEGFVSENNRVRTKVVCLCRCGKEAFINAYHLVSGKQKSCGCKKSGRPGGS